MLGYVTAKKDELKMRDYELYSGYYCGICKSIGKRYGQLPRFTLSYDAAFLALVLAGADDSYDEDDISREHCAIHHIKKKTVVRNGAIDYAGDVMLILAWHKHKDDATDENRMYAKAGMFFKKNLYKKLQKAEPKLCGAITERLAELSELEEQKCDSLDRAAEAFSKIMEEILTCYEPVTKDEKISKILSRMGYHLGKWIYVIDAYDDIEDNIQSGAYNPLIYRYEYNKDSETPAEFKKRITESVEWNLLTYLGEMGKAQDLLEFRRNKDIIENVVYLGLMDSTEVVLGKKERKDKRI